MNAFSASGTPGAGNYRSTSASSFAPRPENKGHATAFPARRVIKKPPTEFLSLEELEKWAEEVELKLGPLIPTKEDKHRVFILLYQYCHLNCVDLTDLPCTDIISHNVELVPGTKPYAVKSQKRWPTHTEWWIQKIIQDGINGGVYEYTQSANGCLSPWNARAVVVDKVENATPEDEPRVTFDYSKVTEVMPGAYMELSSRVHDILSDPRHNVLFLADLKHAYLTIPMDEKCRHFFATTIPGIGQIQPTRVQQGSKGAPFTMTEGIYKAFGCILAPNPEPSLLHSSDPQESPPLTFYMDDFFGGFGDFEGLFVFLRDHFLPRIEWAKFRLSFKKLKLFMSSMKALGVMHSVGGYVHITPSQAEKIAKWPVPCDATGVRAFIGAVGITRRWVKNFMEISRPLTRLMGKVPWKWTESEQLSFKILRIKCATTVQMHGIDFSREFSFYTDASGYGGGLVITQNQHMPSDLTKKKTVEVPILYDAFSLSRTQKLYLTYKKELCVLVRFAMKYDYICKHPYNTTTIHTDHRPLTRFLKSDLHEGIYGHWADQLRRLNVDIRYIPGPRNKVADALSRTIFPGDECCPSQKIRDALGELQKDPMWVWKDGKGGYEEFLRSLSENEKGEVIQGGTYHGASVFTTTATIASDGPEVWRASYLQSAWFKDYYTYLESGNLPEDGARVLRKALDYRIDEETGLLWIHHRNTFLPCIPERKVAAVLREVHDNSGHWGKITTLTKLRGMAYWPGQSSDVERYISGCIQCAQHGPATRSQPLHSVQVMRPFDLAAMDFMGPFEKTAKGNRYIFHFMDYFSRFSIPTATKTADVPDVIRCLRKVFQRYRKPVEIYNDHGQHFDNTELRDFLAKEGVKITYSPSGASKSTSMVEVGNKLLQDVLRKIAARDQWDLSLPASTKSLNCHQIRHLGLSPQDILLGPGTPILAVESKLLTAPGTGSARDIMATLDDPKGQEKVIRKYLLYRAETHDSIKAKSDARKEEEMERYNRGITRTYHAIGTLAMIYQKKTNKLEPRWRGPYRITGYGGSHQHSFTLAQLNGRKIKGNFHGDHLKVFVPREGYLIDPLHPDKDLISYQTIRRSRKKKMRA